MPVGLAFDAALPVAAAERAIPSTRLRAADQRGVADGRLAVVGGAFGAVAVAGLAHGEAAVASGTGALAAVRAGVVGLAGADGDA